jgi:hypothetical protein
MADLPQKLIEIFKAIGLTREQATWDCHGTPVALHKALEQVAEHLGIVFDVPTIIDASAEKKYAAVLVSGRLKDRFEWSVGEAASYNNKNSYPFAMAEKRAKDRVILKLIGVAGFVYSEDEADAFKEERPDSMGGVPQPEPEKPAQQPPAPSLDADNIPFDDNPWRDWVDQEKAKLDNEVTLGAMQAWARRTEKQRQDLQEADRELYAELFDHYNNRYESINSGVR